MNCEPKYYLPACGKGKAPEQLETHNGPGTELAHGGMK